MHEHPGLGSQYSNFRLRFHPRAANLFGSGSNILRFLAPPSEQFGPKNRKKILYCLYDLLKLEHKFQAPAPPSKNFGSGFSHQKLLWLLLHAPAPHPFGHLTSTKFLPEKCWNAAAQTYVLDYKTQPAKSLVKVCVLIPYKRCFPVTFVFVSLVSARKHIWFWNYVSETRSIVNAQSCEEKTYLRGVFFCDHHTITFNVVFNTFSLGGVAEYVRSSSLQSCFFRFST